MVSVLALTLSHKKFKHDTRPALVLRRGSEGAEIENVGPVVAVGITLTLLERTKRPSAALGVTDTLRPGDKSPVRAFDWPEAVAVEMNHNTLEPCPEWVLRMDGHDVHPSGERVASYLLAREGRQILILRFRAVDGSKNLVRLFRSAKIRRDPSTVLRPSVLRNRVWAAVLEKLYAGNAELRPASRLPPFDSSESKGQCS
jgi:hypothetical protein